MSTYKYTYLLTPDNYFNQGQLVFDIEKKLAGNDFELAWDPYRLPFRLMTNIAPETLQKLLSGFPHKFKIELIYSEGSESSESKKPETKPCLGPLRKYKIQSPDKETIDVLLKVLREKYGYFSIDKQGAGAPLAKTEFFMQIKHFVEIDIDLSYADMFKAIKHDMAKMEGYELKFIGSLFNWRDIHCQFENGQTLHLEPLYADPGMPFIEMPSYEELKFKALKEPSITFQNGQVFHFANDPNTKSLSKTHLFNYPKYPKSNRLKSLIELIPSDPILPPIPDDQKKFFQKLEFQYPDHEEISQMMNDGPSAMAIVIEQLINDMNRQEQEILKKVISIYSGHEFSEEQDLPKIERRHFKEDPNKTAILYDGKLLGYIHRVMNKNIEDLTAPFITPTIYFTPAE